MASFTFPRTLFLDPKYLIGFASMYVEIATEVLFLGKQLHENNSKNKEVENPVSL